MDTKKYAEREIEAYLVQQIRQLGGEAYKFTSPGRRAVLDRLCVMPEGIIAFVEVKATGNLPTDAQCREINRLKQKGHLAGFVNSKESVNAVIQYLKQKMKMTNGETDGKS